MAHLAQLVANGLTECGLQRQTFAEMSEARGLACLLRIHTEIDDVHQHLCVTLWLHVATHHSEREVRVVVLQNHCRYQCMERTLARFDAIRMIGIEFEKRSSVLQHDAGVAGNHPRSEIEEDTVDE